MIPKALVLLLALLALSAAQSANTWANVLFNGNSCSNAPTLQASLLVTQAQCVSTGCQSSGGVSGSVTCSSSTSLPPVGVPGSWVSLAVYSTAACTSGTVTSFIALSTSQSCIAYSGQSYAATCSNNRVTWRLYANNNCAGTPVQQGVDLATNECIGAGTQNFGIGIRVSCGSTASVCFHESTEIDYKVGLVG